MTWAEFMVPTPALPVFGDPTGITAYAIDRTDAADSYIKSLGLAASALVAPVITPVFPVPTAAPAPVTTAVPTMQPVIWTSPNIPQAFTGSLDISDMLPAPFDEAAPILAFGAEPVPFSQPAPDAPGINLQFDYPDLVVNLPSPPELLSIQTVPFDGVHMPPDLTQDVPVLTVVAPSIIPYVPGSLYTSALLTAVQTSLQNRIQNGGTGLPPAIEQAIWDRAREREMKATQDALDELDRMERLGYAFPPGVFINSRLKVQTEMGYTVAGLSRDVAIEQAKLEQSNILAALETATKLEGELIQYTNAVEQRLFESTKYATEAGIEIYNAQVRAYAAYLDAYKTKIAVYEAQVRGEIAKVEAYKAQIQAEEVKAQIDTALVQQYKVQADVALSAIEVFKAQIAAIQTKAEIEKIKVQTFGEQVRAYTAQINAYTAGVEAYRATIQAEGTKQEAYRTKVQAYSANVEAAVKSAQAKIEEFRSLIQEKMSEWDAYRAAYGAEAEHARAITSSNANAAEVYRATISGLSAYNETVTKQWEAAINQAERVTEVGVQAAKANAEMYITTRSLALDASKVGAQVSAQLGAAAINAIHWSQSYNTGASWAQSYQFSEIKSVSAS